MARSEVRGFACFNELYERAPVVGAIDFTPRPERIASESLPNLAQFGGAAGGRT